MEKKEMTLMDIAKAITPEVMDAVNYVYDNSPLVIAFSEIEEADFSYIPESLDEDIESLNISLREKVRAQIDRNKEKAMRK